MLNRTYQICDEKGPCIVLGSSFAQMSGSLSADLVKFGFNAGAERLGKLVGALQAEEVISIDDLAGCAGHFAGASGFAFVEIDDICFVEGLAADLYSGKRRSSELIETTSPVVERVIDAIGIAGKSAHDFRGLGPCAALKRLKTDHIDVGSGQEWMKEAKLSAILGSCSASLKSVKSGVRCWSAFAASALNMKGREFPPSLDGLLMWSTLFRCSGTFGNYVNYVRVACLVLGVSTAACDDCALQRAKTAIDKRKQFVKREPLFVQLATVRQMVALTCEGAAPRTMVMLFLTAYIFLLRLPSEALPIVRGCIGWHNEEQAVLTLENDRLVLRLRRRKNRLHGSVLKRSCWCANCRSTCPVHSVWPFFRNFEVGTKPFSGISPGMALAGLRGLLNDLKVPQSGIYRTHDLRRGHARDMQKNGSTLCQILEAGQWKSPAFLTYLDVQALEHDAVVEAHLAESSGEEE